MDRPAISGKERPNVVLKYYKEILLELVILEEFRVGVVRIVPIFCDGGLGGPPSRFHCERFCVELC